jgi:hypothetical protein
MLILMIFIVLIHIRIGMLYTLIDPQIRFRRVGMKLGRPSVSVHPVIDLARLRSSAEAHPGHRMDGDGRRDGDRVRASAESLLYQPAGPAAGHLPQRGALGGRDLSDRTCSRNDRRARTTLVRPAVIAAGAFAIATILGRGNCVGGATDSLVMRWWTSCSRCPATPAS